MGASVDTDGPRDRPGPCTPRRARRKRRVRAGGCGPRAKPVAERRRAREARPWLQNIPHVVIIGGGFGGLEAARALRNAPVRVTLVDRRNHHLFQPLLYQVATAGLSAVDIAAPIRQILRHQRNVTVLLDEAVSIDASAQRVQLGTQTLAYDWLVLAAGVTNTWFGNDEAWSPHAPGLKTLDQALDLRRRMLFAYEAAERATDAAERASGLTFVVIGAGPTGVEMAGALSEIARTTLTRDFRNFDPATARVVLLEGGDRVLPAFPPALSDAAQAQLASIGVDVRLGQRVSHIDAEGVTVGETHIPSRTVVWAAGVRGEGVAATLGVELDRPGRVPVDEHLRIAGHENVFVIGDLARFEQQGVALPGVAPVALQQGRHTGRVIAARVTGRDMPAPFVYFDKGSMATIGRSRAVAMMGVGRSWPAGKPALTFRGHLAWLAWLFVHVLVLVTFRNRVKVLLEWVWAYVTYQRSARLLL